MSMFSSSRPMHLAAVRSPRGSIRSCDVIERTDFIGHAFGVTQGMFMFSSALGVENHGVAAVCGSVSKVVLACQHEALRRGALQDA